MPDAPRALTSPALLLFLLLPLNMASTGIAARHRRLKFQFEIERKYQPVFLTATLLCHLPRALFSAVSTSTSRPRSCLPPSSALLAQSPPARPALPAAATAVVAAATATATAVDLPAAASAATRRWDLARTSTRSSVVVSDVAAVAVAARQWAVAPPLPKNLVVVFRQVQCGVRALVNLSRRNQLYVISFRSSSQKKQKKQTVAA